jgi:lysozyme
MKINEATLHHLKRSEGLRLRAYPDPATGGEPWTIGYGHTSMAGPPQVKRGMVISREEAEAILRRDVEKFAQGVEALIKVPVNENQFGALVSFAFNVGLGNLRKSTLLRMLNAGNYAGAAGQFPKWTKAAGKAMPGLVTRRRGEQALFLKK